MRLTEYSVKNKVTSWMFALILLIGGIISYNGLGRLEDPEFTLKMAMITTTYPGASSVQVEEEVSYPIENALQQLPYVDYITSISSAGLSQIVVEMKPTYRKEDLKQIWDELRRKIHDLEPKLSPGVNSPNVIDDFGDVYGVLLAISGDGYSYEEQKDYVDYLRRELVLVKGVGKVTVAGLQQEQVVVEIARNKLAALGIPPSRIYQLLQTQNQVSNSGSVKVGSEYIRLHPSGEFQSVKELENLLISNPGASELIYLGDVATINRAYAEVPQNIINYNNRQALLVGVSFSSGVNVVEIGEKLEQRLAELEYVRPVGMEVSVVYNQPVEVDKAMQGFMVSLAQAVVIVIAVLLIFMGLKSGILIGLILLLTILGSFIFMKLFAIDLQRISLGALIIALGMLVDNAIVVTEGILIGLKKGKTKLQASLEITKQTNLPLLGATVIAIAAFAPIGLSSDATGEFAGSLFWVLLISLLLSWITAISLTPFFADLMFKENPVNNQQNSGDQDTSAESSELYRGAIFTGYKALLNFCLRFRGLTLLVMLGLLIAAVAGFGQVKQSFFPPSNTPMFYLDYWRYQGSDIRETQKDIEAIQAYLLTQDKVEQITTTTGQGAPRFMLTYGPEKAYAGFGQLIVRVENREALNPVMANLRQYMNDNYPQAQSKIKRMEIGPSTDAKIEARFSGPDPDVLRHLGQQAMAKLDADPGAYNIRHDWRERTKVIRPEFNEATGRRVGISKQDLDDLLLTNFSGQQVGLYREGTQLLPIVARAPKAERLNIDSLPELQIYSQAANTYVPITQVVNSFNTDWEDSLIMRRDRKRTLTVMADHDVLGDETAASLFNRVKPEIEAIELPPGYQMEWGGEYESSSDAQAALFGGLPMGYLAMFIITVLLFNSLKAPLVIWATVPLALIGVAAGLLLMGAPFSFMALLGLLSLSGMLIKNGIVLVDQINLELGQGKDPYLAVFDSAVSRVRPVAMAAITTILGMIPLLFDAFFESMAVTIMFGLGFATVLTLIVVPVLFTLLYKIPYRQQVKKA
ncbi:efflux RND transporter permease subunit [Thalassomonas actiniarum]|uniref:Efflux RND transporter permease subunit n=1 Tax=Thalassomonas actiniarum TaxID=485447 RepID=A0AAE9YVJ5_9GAMM|nr:efflux RND transporter permease subunit [Thalassomonas actiniarum]WDE01130.1 efflux RND transporter permease subunit [Thalassomonas actiniarum]